ncbi:hypothetical protein M2152_001504 [Microbacteriaceae bacterium SG_E_30_P1]|uniref:Uncharacterized protein n=1 Tax=Antiquaquibacter oligotrophicus TaxID=2880260 RepID=A0ABT6KQ56_9MICO|nr:DUF6412 domain-containing protein [Antiquaquibacter oligotrophicus]MDH6181322.1 hypothetical protein [Antiquaquibacter oligotrophicus]UDF12985.1 DUF6412 domain-containing protein [Antiquaquibacter oligotrophicus]
MTTAVHRLLAALGILLVLTVTAPDAGAVVFAGASLAVAALLAANIAVAVLGSREITVGYRARAHRESFSSSPEPSHPATPGRTRARAPGAFALTAF